MRTEKFWFIYDDKYRSKGLGGRILEMAIEQIFEVFGQRGLALGVHKDNIKVRPFYERHGFKKTGVYEGYDEYYLRNL